MIYVDWLCNHGMQMYGNSVLSCHMYSNDNKRELIEFAKTLGFKIFIGRFDHHPYLHISRVGIPHFDLTKSKRELAVSLGAIEITKRSNLRAFLQRLRNVYDNEYRREL